LLKGEVPSEYKDQMLVEMACTGRQWCDLVSFDPRLPRELELFVKRLHRDDVRIAEIEAKVEEFLEEIRDMLVRLSSLGDLEVILRKSLAQVQAQKGPQLVVASLDAAPTTG
jgi:predicted LPLAT superfamily acyltransferase